MKIYDKIAALNPTELVKKTITVAFLGDSVTQGCFEVYKKAKTKSKRFTTQSARIV